MYHYVRFAVGLLLPGSVCLHACQPKEVTTELPPDHIVLKAGGSVRLAFGLMVRVDSISDSRCPIGYNCVLAGEASALVTISAETDIQKRRLIAGYAFKDRRDSLAVQANSAIYKVILRDVTPHPFKDERPEQQAVIQISRL